MNLKPKTKMVYAYLVWNYLLPDHNGGFFGGNFLAITLILALDSQTQVFPDKLEAGACSVFFPLHSGAKKTRAHAHSYPSQL